MYAVEREVPAAVASSLAPVPSGSALLSVHLGPRSQERLRIHRFSGPSPGASIQKQRPVCQAVAFEFYLESNMAPLQTLRQSMAS